jgi:hypothetical protein
MREKDGWIETGPGTFNLPIDITRRLMVKIFHPAGI